MICKYSSEMAEYAVADVVVAAATIDVTEYASKSEIHCKFSAQ